MLDALDIHVLSEWTVLEPPIYFSYENKSSDVFIFRYYGELYIKCFIFYYNDDESGGDNGKKKKKTLSAFVMYMH